MTLRFEVLYEQATGKTLLIDPVTRERCGEVEFEASPQPGEEPSFTLSFEPELAAFIERHPGSVRWKLLQRGLLPQPSELTFELTFAGEEAA